MIYIQKENNFYCEKNVGNTTITTMVPELKLKCLNLEYYGKVGEAIAIQFVWTKLDLQEKDYVEDSSITTAIKVEVVNAVNPEEVIDSIEIPAGEALEFSADEPGEFIIRTVNPKVANTEIKVVVEDA